MGRKKLSEKGIDYTKPALRNFDGDLNKRWYIEFHVQNDSGKFVRKRITSINSGRTYKDRMEDARKALKEITIMLQEGFRPSGSSPELDEDNTSIDIKKITFIEAIQFAINKKAGIVSKKTVWDYNAFRNTVEEFLKKKKCQDLKFKKVNLQLLYDFFDWLRGEKNIGNKTFNNYHTNMNSVFNLFFNRGLISDNPCKNIKKLKAEKGGNHKAFTSDQLANLKKEMLNQGEEQLFLFVSFIYYCFIRPHQELRFLKVEHIQDKTIFIPADLSKNGKGEHVIIPPGLEDLIQKYKIREFPKDYFIFSRKGTPGEKNVGKEYFYDKHVKILKAVKLHGKGYDIYGYKHTGNIHLFKAGADIKAIQNHNRHSSIDMTDKYLKDLGLITNDDVFKKFPKF